MSEINIPYIVDPPADLSMRRAPELVLEEAKRAAKCLQDVISRKARPVRFNGEQYLEFEDWQTVARFYGITAKVVSTAAIDLGDVRGFEARAVAINTNTGEEVSAADSMCLNDEPNWRSKPLFQLRSMAQTRACAKALRNVLSWVVVLAGYRPTPAEEMDGVFQTSRTTQPKPEVKAPRRQEPKPEAEARQADARQEPPGDGMISAAQVVALWQAAEKSGKTKDEVRSFIYVVTGQESSKMIPKTQFQEVYKWASARQEKAKDPGDLFPPETMTQGNGHDRPSKF